MENKKVIHLDAKRRMKTPNPYKGHSSGVTQLIMPASERCRIQWEGTRAERRKLERLEASEERKFQTSKQEDRTMKLTATEINNPVFLGTLQKLDCCTKFSTQMAWNVMKTVKKCHELVKEQREFYQTLTKTYSELDEAGNIKVVDGKIVYKTPEAATEHAEKFKDYMKVEFDLVGKPLDFSAMEAAQLSPMEIGAILPLLDSDTLPKD